MPNSNFYTSNYFNCILKNHILSHLDPACFAYPESTRQILSLRNQVPAGLLRSMTKLSATALRRNLLPRSLPAWEFPCLFPSWWWPHTSDWKVTHPLWELPLPETCQAHQSKARCALLPPAGLFFNKPPNPQTKQKEKTCHWRKNGHKESCLHTQGIENLVLSIHISFRGRIR